MNSLSAKNTDVERTKAHYLLSVELTPDALCTDRRRQRPTIWDHRNRRQDEVYEWVEAEEMGVVEEGVALPKFPLAPMDLPNDGGKMPSDPYNHCLGTTCNKGGKREKRT